ncbi:PTS transporter subunit EIIC, partial [uncultured Faecalibaculum sp.]
FCAKSEQLSVLGKASIGPAIFNINEPLVFGVPIIYNPNLIIPFILAPSLASVVAYFAISSGLFPPIIANVPWPTPALLGGFIGTANLMGGLLALITVVLAFLIYWPFLKAYDKKLVQQEKEMAEAEGQ